jgi:sugar phosphate isomerase/epimerase
MHRLGVAEWSISDCRSEVIKAVRTAGFDFLHLSYGEHGRSDCLDSSSFRIDLLKEAKKYDVEITVVAVNCVEKIGFENSRALQICCQTMLDAIDVAGELGARMVYFPSFHLTEIRGPSELDNTLTILRRAAVHAERRGLLLGTENTLNAEACRALLKAAKTDKLRLLLDVFNPVLFGHDVQEIIRVNSERIFDDVHVKDGDLRSGKLVPVGSGDGKVVNTIKVLEQFGRKFNYILEGNYLGKHGIERAKDDRKKLLEILKGSG